jgi:diguanylate cyclase (GGDEF)-like protein/PAS domain S-box-containing protein
VGIARIPKYRLAVLTGVDTALQMAPDRTRKHIVLLFALLFPLLLAGATRMILQSLERRQSMEKTMRERERLAASVFTHAREGIVITDISGHILDINSTFTQITGFTREEVMGRTPHMLQSDRQSPEFYATQWQHLHDQGHWSGDLWCSRSDGGVFSALMTVSAVRDAGNVLQHYVALFTDITEIKDHQRQLVHMAHYDSLSSLPNRVLLADRLRQAMLQCHRRNKWLAVAFLDLDGFKEVNDLHGHDIGDQMLVAVAQNMKAALRDGDTLARIGGDEFVAVLADLDNEAECYSVLDRLLLAAQVQNVIRRKSDSHHPELQLQVSTSIGFTFYPQDNVDADQLLRQADQAMYQAKQAGKNRYHLFDVALDVALKSHTESIERMRLALANEEFVLHYQPKVNMATGQVVGAEALIRWAHPERGLLAPLQFLPLVENHRLGIDVGEWVIRTALAQMAHWQTQNLFLGVSVNISAHQLHQESFPRRLADLLATYPMVKPADLQLEILETSAMEDMGKVTENIHRCHTLGVRFALDDFGTGYSSLTYLKRLPAETLKIDQSFVRDMLQDADDLAIVRSVIGLAQTLRRTVIAEGVETPAHGALLITLGCPLAQGYGIARPMPSADLPAWVEQWRPNFG